MIPELGHFALILALAQALAQAGCGLAGAQTGRQAWLAVVRPAAAGQFVFVALAFGCLTWAFVQNDFSVSYVAQNSNSALPLPYRIAAVWGAHEGSLLLWILVLAGWTLAAAAFSRSLPERFAGRMLGVLGAVSIGFMLFTLTTSNPFDRLVPAALDGRDLNPILQDPALAMHPPMLYLGYVGFSVAFAFAIAAMLEGRLDSAWARWTRPWTTLAWLFLTVGIALGSWWAYYELGWGGWWFWDPVENASFMPWLAGTALIHSLAVTESRGMFRSWTLLLSIAAFSLSLLGTFLVRSGVLISVHSFASDPARGLYILVFLAVVVGGALILYAWRAPQLRTDSGFHPLSRESFLLFNNVLLVIAALLILLGTLYPLFIDALGLGKLSVGPPYFATVFLVPALPLVLLLGLGMHADWKQARVERLRRRVSVPFWLAVAAGIALPWLVYGRSGLLVAAGVFAGVWVIGAALAEPVARWHSGRRPSRAVLGMSLAHVGVGVFALGVAVTTAFDEEIDLALRPGEATTLAGYEFTYESQRQLGGPNYRAEEARIVVTRDGQQVSVLTPQKRIYRVQTNPMTEADIDAGIGRDLYVALGEPVGDGAWSMRLHYKPLVRLIWLGALLMAAGGVLAVTDRRYRRARRSLEEAADEGARISHGVAR